jgi:MFS family permease
MGTVSASPARRSPAVSALIVSSGNFLEMYDFMVYGYYAQAIAKAYFPAADPYASTLATFAAFGAGFLMRPVGAVVLGALIDRIGRRTGLMVTLGLMAVGTATIAATPGYARIGLAAPLAVVIGRLVQGLSAGVELGGVSVYLAEMAGPRSKGFWVSWQSASQQVAVVFAALIGVTLAGRLDAAAMAAWGWRIPFILGCALIPFLFLIGSQLQETPAFAQRTERPSFAQILASVGANAPVIGLGAMMVTLTTVTFYLVTAYTPTYGTEVLHLSTRKAFGATLCVGLLNFALLPAAGALSDRIGRRPILVAAALALLFTAYPVLHWLAAAPSFGRLLAAELWLAALYATYNGAMVVHLTEIMPAAARTSAFSLAYSLATALFGGFTPLICTWLIHATGDKAAPGLWVGAAAMLALAGVLGLRLARKRAPILN